MHFNETKVVATSALKGGVGKSTISISLAYVLAQEFEKKVLLIDSDPQSSASIILGVTPNSYDKRTPFDSVAEAMRKVEKEDMSYEVDELDEESNSEDYIEELDVNGIHTIFDEMLTGRPITKTLVDKCIHRPYFQLKENKMENGRIVRDENGSVVREVNYYGFGFDLMPSTEYLSDILLTWSGGGMKDKRNVGRQMDQVVEFIKSQYDYDFIIIDCPPSLELLTINAIYAAKDGVIIPVSQDKQSLFSLVRIKRTIRDIKHISKGHKGILGVVLSVFNEKRIVDKYISMTVGKDLKLHVFNTKISETTDAKKALLSGLILPQTNKRNYTENISLCKEIFERIDYLSERIKGEQ